LVGAETEDGIREKAIHYVQGGKMSRKILLNGTAGKVDGSLLAAAPPVSRAQMSSVELDRSLRLKRSPKYMEAIRKLDAGIQSTDKNAYEEVLKAIKEELPEVMLQYPLQGVVAKCYLGPPYEVHSLDLCGQIIQHYEMLRPLPGILERARSLALHSEYIFIEVYYDKLVAVRQDGSTSVSNC
jgi:hypothetical protein